jgi:transcription elongation GreA/GreB family factor
MSIKVGDLVKIDYNGKVMKLRLQKEVDSNCVTVNSPIGQVLLGADVGDIFRVLTPNGVTVIKILEVNAGDALP